MKTAGYSLVIIGVMMLSACEVGPDYVRPDAPTPIMYKEAQNWKPAAPNDAANRGSWWSIYNDPVLDLLERQVDVSNQNLKATEAAWREASAIADETRASLFPLVSLDGSTSTAGNGQPHGKTQTTFNFGAGATWDLDVWGRIRREIESNEATAQASAADLASARLSAQAALATDYFELRVVDQLKRLLDDSVEADRKILTIVQNQYQQGVAAKADVLAAETQLQSVRAQAVNTGVQRAQLEHAIAVLIGKPPAEFALAPAPLRDTVPVIPAGLPSTLLERRPDIASNERQMASSNALIGAAEAAFYPDITLSASAGYSSVALGKLLNASSSLWSFGPSLSETVFDAGAREAAVEAARASFDQTVANYRQTVLTAFQQVEDNLAALRILERQARVEDQAVASARQAENLTLNQYKEGTVPYNTVLTAQIVTLSNEQTALTVTGSRLTASVALVQATGGGWDTSQLPQY